MMILLSDLNLDQSLQMPYKHINEEQGCPSCRDSKGASLICNYLDQRNINYEREKIIEGCVSDNNVPLRFDFYLPQKDVYIEYDGEQHFRPVKNWGGKEGFEDVQMRDQIKDTFCNENNIELYRISYKEDVLKVLKNITI